MRLLHSSDWHLGRAFHGQDLLEHQAAYVDHLLEVIEAEQVDVVLLAGDVFDRALPPVDAVALADEAFARIAASRARLVVTSGNHDSGRRLGLNARLIDAAGVHIRTVADNCDVPVLLEDEHGVVAVYGIPYLEPDVLRGPWDLPARSHHAALAEATHRIRADLAGRPGARSVVLAHAFVAGAAPSDSERDISVGGVAMVSASLFEDFGYAALGHLHGRHTLAPHLRYSGSPLAYSFSEAAHTKGSWLVELGAGGVETATFVEAPVPRCLARLTGTLEDLLSSDAHSGAEQAWVQAVLTDAVRPLDAMARLQRRFPHAVALQYAPAGGGATSTRVPLTGRSDHEVALDFVVAVRGVEATTEEAALLQQAVDACCHDRDADVVVGA